MFQFHGWAVLRYHTHDNDSKAQEYYLNKLVKIISKLDSEKLVLFKTRNGMESILISGMHNHKSEYVIEIFKQVGINMPGSYGLLFVHDDEDINGEIDNSNKFVVWKLVRGELVKQQDLYLSPLIPTVEDEYDPFRND